MGASDLAVFLEVWRGKEAQSASVPIIAPAPRHCEPSEASISLRDGPPPSSKDPRREDEAWPHRWAGGRGIVDCFASLAMTGSQMGVVDSSIVGRRQSYGRPDFLARIIQPLLCGLNRMQSGSFPVADAP